MDKQQIEDNVARFLALGFTRARELVNGYPLVYRLETRGDVVFCREIHIVTERTLPETCPAGAGQSLAPDEMSLIQCEILAAK
jgi:hypothetical protein